MIEILQNRNDFEYDIRALIASFYRGEEIFFEETKESILRAVFTYDDEGVLIEFFSKERDMSKKVIFEKELDRKAKKNILKKKLYEMLSAHTGTELSWGTLSGIRPVKIPLSMLYSNCKDEEIAQYMRDNYLTSDEKIDLSIEVAKHEKRLLDNLDYENGYSLYIGIPFCPSTCLYCSFTSYPLGLWADKMDMYLDALIKELEYIAVRYKDRHLNTVYVGGGTPTSLNEHQLDRLLRAVSDNYDMTHVREVTVEAGRPDSITREKLMAIKRNGVTRISINPQTMKEETLKIIGRHHTVEDTIRAYNLARECGFDNINMDLIVGLPDEDIEDVRHTMEEIKRLAPESVTVHSLAIKRAARLNMDKDKYKNLSIVNTEEIIDLTRDYCKSMGLNPYYLYRQKNMAGNYENVGYARLDKEGIYNILIMEEKQTIIAAGAGAASKIVSPSHDKIDRIENVKDVRNYIDRIDEMIERKKKYM